MGYFSCSLVKGAWVTSRVGYFMGYVFDGFRRWLLRHHIGPSPALGGRSTAVADVVVSPADLLSTAELLQSRQGG